MYFADYINEVYNDGRAYIDENIEYYDDFDTIYDYMWCADSVTGNGSGSYTFSTHVAQQNVAEVIWDEDFLDELVGIGWSIEDTFKQGAEALDVTARCLALGRNYSKLEEYYNELKGESE